MKIALLLLILSSCVQQTTEEEINGKAYTFFIEDAKSIDGSIRWGVDGIQYTDRVNAYGYASGFNVKPEDLFFIQVDCSGPVKLTISLNHSNSSHTTTINPNTLYQLKP